MTGVEMGIIASQSMAAIGTFSLAVVAFKAMYQNRELQRTRSMEERLREVADWAVDAMAAPNRAEILPTPPDLASWEEPARVVYLAQARNRVGANVARELAFIVSRGEYIRRIAERLDKNLHSKVEVAISCAANFKNDIERSQFSEVKDELFDELIKAATQVLERTSERLFNPSAIVSPP